MICASVYDVTLGAPRRVDLALSPLGLVAHRAMRLVFAVLS